MSHPIVAESKPLEIFGPPHVGVYYHPHSSSPATSAFLLLSRITPKRAPNPAQDPTFCLFHTKMIMAVLSALYLDGSDLCLVGNKRLHSLHGISHNSFLP